jgi:hypothetical protein
MPGGFTPGETGGQAVPGGQPPIDGGVGEHVDPCGWVPGGHGIGGLIIGGIRIGGSTMMCGGQIGGSTVGGV